MQEGTIGRREMIAGTGAMALASVLGGRGLAQGGETKKIVAINGSPRGGKTTAAALGICLEAAAKENPSLETELIELADLSIPAQLAAGLALREGEKDDFPEIAKKLSDPSVAGILIGSPVYFSNMTALCKAFLDRCISFRKGGFTLQNKVAGVVSVGGARNGGQEVTIQSIQAALACQDMILVGTGKPSGRSGATLWSVEDSIEQDEFGKGLAADLGKRVAEVAALSVN